MDKPNSLLLTRKRLLIVVLSIAFLFCALSVRLLYLQVFKGSWLQSKAAQQWYRDLPLEAAVKLAQFYGTSVDYLVGLTGRKKPYPA